MSRINMSSKVIIALANQLDQKAEEVRRLEQSIMETLIMCRDSVISVEIKEKTDLATRQLSECRRLADLLHALSTEIKLTEEKYSRAESEAINRIGHF